MPSTSPAPLSDGQPSLGGLLTRVGGATADFYSGLGRLALTYLQDVAVALASGHPEGEIAAVSEAPAPLAEAGTLVLQAEAGRAALGAFVVESERDEVITVPLAVSPFVDDAGREVTPTVTFEPGEVRLAKGEKTIVRFLVNVDDNLKTGVEYRAVVTLPGLTNHGIPLLLRRRPRSRTTTKARSPDDAGSTPSEPTESAPSTDDH